jgi:hypothetical protein
MVENESKNEVALPRSTIWILVQGCYIAKDVVSDCFV